ncbi:LLM class flavin-dependent oxidoreductase [Naumannella halotolerans]|uniref:LLM class flavin-dependent oxidoreductase n=1 Tax=Naumannella halotolerans TaxID=993414 RepID=UPI00370D429A
MPRPGEPLRRLGVLTIGLFDPADPGAGHRETLAMIEFAEELGLDSVWLRDRHLQHGISSPVAVLAAAAMRTSRIEFGTAVIPLGAENPLRLAEDLATVDILSGGRLNPGVSSGTPMNFERYREAMYPDTLESEDFSKQRVIRLRNFLRGDPISAAGTVGIEEFSDHVQPHSPGLAQRLWYGGGRDSAIWTGQQGLNYLTSSVVFAAGTGVDGSEPDAFARVQAGDVAAFREHHPAGAKARASQGLVVIPTDSASAEQKRRYHAYAESRLERTRTAHGPRGLLFSPDLVGDSSELADRLWSHAGFREVDEVVFALPFTFEAEDYRQILTDLAQSLGPALGWSPRLS